jgi:hypothetical protein
MLEYNKKPFRPFHKPGQGDEDERAQIPRDFLRQNYNRKDRLAVVTIERSAEGKAGRIHHYFQTAEEIASPEFQRMLRAANANGRDVYLTPNTLRSVATGRTKADVDEIRHIYLDVDVGGKEALERILKAEGMPDPHHVLETSPGKHQILWQVEGYGKEEAEQTLRNLAAAHGADPAVTDCSRVLRVPGFRNCKYADRPHYVRDVHVHPPSQVYGPSDFPKYPEVERPVRPPGERPRSSSQVSQSERDWAYALRQLAKGTDPAVIRANIEDFRQDKANPRYYAERTVSRAEAYIAANRLTGSEVAVPAHPAEAMER